jgi:hypothetical protein
VAGPSKVSIGANNDEKDALPMVDILNLALPYFGLIFIGFACGKARGLPEQGLTWMNFFLLYVSLPALLFGIMSKTPFEELNNPPFLIATALGTASAFVLALFAGRLIGRLPLREATLAGLSGAYGNIGYMGPGLALAVLGTKAAAPTALIFCCDSIFLFTIVPLLIALTDREHPSLLHTFGVVARQIVLNPLIMSACAGALAAALHIHPPGRDRQHAVVSAKRRGAGGAVRARGDGSAAAVWPRALGGSRRHRGKTPDPPTGRIRTDAAVRALRTAMGGHRDPDGIAAAGAQCVRDRPAKRQLDRARVRRRADRNVRVRHHAYQRDVVHADRPAGVSLET